jgi:hypothetical protein
MPCVSGDSAAQRLRPLVSVSPDPDHSADQFKAETKSATIQLASSCSFRSNAAFGSHSLMTLLESEGF